MFTDDTFERSTKTNEVKRTLGSSPGLAVYARVREVFDQCRGYRGGVRERRERDKLDSVTDETKNSGDDECSGRCTYNT